jgi:hypothetical protein
MEEGGEASPVPVLAAPDRAPEPRHRYDVVGEFEGTEATEIALKELGIVDSQGGTSVGRLVFRGFRNRVHTDTCTHSYTQTHTRTQTHAHTHAHTHTYTHEHMYTHMYTHWQVSDLGSERTKGKRAKRAYYELLADLTEEKELLEGRVNLCPRRDDWRPPELAVSAADLLKSLRQLGQTLFGDFRARVKEFAARKIAAEVSPSLGADTRAVLMRLSTGLDVPATQLAIQVTMHEHTHNTCTNAGIRACTHTVTDTRHLNFRCTLSPSTSGTWKRP